MRLGMIHAIATLKQRSIYNVYIFKQSEFVLCQEQA